MSFCCGSFELCKSSQKSEEEEFNALLNVYSENSERGLTEDFIDLYNDIGDKITDFEESAILNVFFKLLEINTGKLETLSSTVKLISEATNETDFLNLYRTADKLDNGGSYLDGGIRAYCKTFMKHYLNILPSSQIDYLYNYITTKKGTEGLIATKLFSLVLSMASNNKLTLNDPRIEEICNKVPLVNKVPKNFPTNFFTKEGINYFINQASFPFDLIEKRGDDYIIDTCFMNDYNMKPNAVPVGCTGYFKITPSGFSLQNVVLDPRFADTLLRGLTPEIEPEQFKLRCFYVSTGLYQTICSHFFQSHYLVACNIGYLTRDKLPFDHPLRKLLIPTEFNTIQLIMKGTLSLIKRGSSSLFYHMGIYTDDGIEAMLSDYLKKYKHDFVNFLTKNPLFSEKYKLTTKELSYVPFKTYNKYYKVIQKFATSFVKELYEQKLVTKPVRQWMKSIYPVGDIPEEELLYRIIGGIYFEQVRHTMLSNSSICYYSARYLPSLYRDPDSGSLYYPLSSLLSVIFTTTGTSADLLDISMEFGFLLPDNKLRTTYSEFIKDLKSIILEEDDLDLLAVTNINTSTGV